MTHDPTVVFVNNEWVNHPDHRAVGQVTVDAVYPTARDPLNFPEHIAQGLGAWKVAELYLWSTNEANQIVDIGDTIERKVAALAPPQPVPRLRRDGALAPSSGGGAR